MRTNAELMSEGHAPHVLKNGKYEQIQLHHSRQDGRGSLFEMTKQTHLHTNNENGRQAIHPYLPSTHPEFSVNRKMFNNDQTQYWKDRLKQLQQKEK